MSPRKLKIVLEDFFTFGKKKKRKLLSPYKLTIYNNELMSIKEARVQGGKLGGKHGIKGREDGIKGKEHGHLSEEKNPGGVYRGRMASMEKRKFIPENHQHPGPPMIKPLTKVWDCEGIGCQFSCTNRQSCSLLSFVGMDEITVYMWAVRHQIIPTLCFYCDTDKGTPTSFSPTGSCVPRTVKVRGKETVGLYCKRCCKTSKGGRRGFFLGQKTDLVRSMCNVYVVLYC